MKRSLLQLLQPGASLQEETAKDVNHNGATTNGHHHHHRSVVLPRRRRSITCGQAFMSIFVFTACVGNYVWLTRQQQERQQKHQGYTVEVEADLPTTTTTTTTSSESSSNNLKVMRVGKRLGNIQNRVQKRILSLSEQLQQHHQEQQQQQPETTTTTNQRGTIITRTNTVTHDDKATFPGQKGNVPPKKPPQPASAASNQLGNKEKPKESFIAAISKEIAATNKGKQQSTAAAKSKVVYQSPPVKAPKKSKKKRPLLSKKQVKDESPKTILQYAPNRIPGYFTNSNDTRILFGHVTREFTRRIMAGGDSSNTGKIVVVVVSPNATQVVNRLKSLGTISSTQEGELRRQLDHRVGSCTLLHAHRQGLEYHGLDRTTRLDEWWDDQSQSKPSSNHQAAAVLLSPPNKLLLTMIDHGLNNDEILNNNTNTFLQRSNPRYIVVGIGAYKNGTIYGQEAVQVLLQQHYKVMILSLSHIPYGEERRNLVAPNALLTPQSAPKVFHTLKMGAKMTKRPILGFVFATLGLDLAIPTATIYEPQIGKGSTGVEYLQCPTTGLKLGFYNPTVERNIVRMIQKQPNKARAPFSLQCHEKRLQAPFFNYTNIGGSSTLQQQQQQQQGSSHVWLSGPDLQSSEAVCVKAVCEEDDERGVSPSSSSLAMMETQNACLTRILLQPSEQAREQRRRLSLDEVQSSQSQARTQGKTSTISKTKGFGSASATDQEQTLSRMAPSKSSRRKDGKPNLLMLMVESISRPRFERSLVKTTKVLERLNFTTFSRYTAIADNSSESNQQALFSGRARAGKEQQEWLWDTLKAHGYKTLKASDSCDPSGSGSSTTDHGDAFGRMMCFDFQRPNCLGERSAAQHLVDYGIQFMRAYTEQEDEAWAAFLQFVDAKEDTQTLAGTLDEPLWKFLYSIHDEHKRCRIGTTTPTAATPKHTSEIAIPCSVWDNTMIVVLSDQGIDYGTYAMFPQGMKERAMPVLHMHLPKRHQSPVNTKALEANRQLWTTPMDVYETILDVLVSKEPTGASMDGASLIKPLSESRMSCKTTIGVPSHICDTLQHDTRSDAVIMPPQPSVMSFYADVPRSNKEPRPLCNVVASNDTIFENQSMCKCATNLRSWYECTEHPWEVATTETSATTYSMVDCGETGRSFEIHVHRDPKVVERPEVVKAKSGTAKPRPNILFVEMDSVSTAYADRHLRRTREVLANIRLTKNATDPSGFDCGGSDTICSTEFESVSVVGASSIPNQVAVMGGCTVAVGPEVCSSLQTDTRNRTICNDPTNAAYGMELVNRLRTSATFCRVDDAKRSPWIFDIAKASGYVTLFAEDFCYDGSVYVPQNNVFTLNADVLPSSFFCRVGELRKFKSGPDMVRPAWQYTYKPATGDPGCVDENGGYESGLVALHHIESMWNAYSDIPKLAYINGIAAHQYKEFRTMADDAETYDTMLSSFLKRMLAREDMANTIIVVRADHGLQAGPATPDYSIQVEALRPWTEIIVPKTLAGLSLSNLYENRRRLTTGFDLYNTLTTAIVGSEKGLIQDPPSWSHHLWNDVIPETRTCADAQVRSDYCVFDSQRTYTAANLRSCNMVEDDQRLVCPSFADEFKEGMSSSVSNYFYSRTIQERVCPGGNDATAATSPAFVEEWNMIDQEAAKQSKEAEENPMPFRQATILTGIIADLANGMMAKENRPLNVCQTGFGGGHAIALFLAASPHVRVHVFSRWRPRAQTPILNLLKRRFGDDRFEHHIGDPCEFVPLRLAPVQQDGNEIIKCDILHGSNPACSKDNVDLVENAPGGALLTSIAANTLRDPYVYFGKDCQWLKLEKRGCLRDISCFSADREADSKTIKKFCIAVTTGKCQKLKKIRNDNDSSTTAIGQLTRRIVLGHICPSHDSPIPRQQVRAQQSSATMKKPAQKTKGNNKQKA